MRRDTSLLDPKHGLWWQNQSSRMQLCICYWKQHMITANGFLIACPSGKYRYNYLKVKSHPQLPMLPMCKTQWAHNINRGLFTMFLAQTSLSTIAQWNIFALSLSPEYVFLINLNAYPKITLLNKHYSHSCDLKSKGCYLGTFPFRIAMNHHSWVEGQEGVYEQHPAGGTHIQGYKRLSCRSVKSLFTKN